MIIGTPLILLASGILRVTSAPGATITLTKGSLTYTITSGTAVDSWYSQYSRRVAFGTWTVKSVYNGETKTKTVTINSTGTTDTKIVHTISIFKAGSGLDSRFSFKKFTGGFSVNSNQIDSWAGDSGWLQLITNQAIPHIADFKQIRINAKADNGYGYSAVGIRNRTDTWGSDSPYNGFTKWGGIEAGATVDHYLDISGLTSGNYYPAAGRTDGPSHIYIYNIQLIPN